MDPAPAAVAADPLRPRRTPYLVAALIAVGGVLAAAAVLFLVPVGGDLGQRITPGQPVTVQVPEAGKMVWAKDSGPQNFPGVGCAPSSADTQEIEEWTTVSMRLDDLTLKANGERWRGVMMVHASPAGRYTVTCTASAADGTPSLSIGDPPRFHDPRSKALGVLAASVLASLGVLVGTVLAVVVAVRRRRRHSSQAGWVTPA
ncbi:hypothetical protein ACQP08_01425 [Micromonospora zamorensis]|uniref:hypothetical protein n=1 Tax=Micromonospora zamorensis TaxID=709883 RepID=UPI003D92908B